MKTRGPRRFPGVALAVVALMHTLPGNAAAGPAAAPVPPPVTQAAMDGAGDDEDAQLVELTGTLEELLAIVEAEHPDALAIPEAEEMGLVAEELAQEGDKDLAASLLAEAIALLEEEGG